MRSPRKGASGTGPGRRGSNLGRSRTSRPSPSPAPRTGRVLARLGLGSETERAGVHRPCSLRGRACCEFRGRDLLCER
eukprot:2946780-Rhodomonas_salina.1